VRCRTGPNHWAGGAGFDPIERVGFSPSSLRACPQRDGKVNMRKVNMRKVNMTPTEDNRPARRHDELARGRRSRRVSAAIDAQRRLTAAPVRVIHAKTDPVSPRDPPYSYLRESTISRA
jgi:hypothetical protein